MQQTHPIFDHCTFPYDMCSSSGQHASFTWKTKIPIGEPAVLMATGKPFWNHFLTNRILIFSSNRVVMKDPKEQTMSELFGSGKLLPKRSNSILSVRFKFSVKGYDSSPFSVEEGEKVRSLIRGSFGEPPNVKLICFEDILLFLGEGCLYISPYN